MIESSALREERAAGRLLYGGYGTVQPGLLRRLRMTVKNTGNTSVLHWQGRLYALMEMAPPTEMDPETLATLGERDLEGVVVRSFSAHHHPVPARGALYNFGVRYGRHTEVDLYELPLEGRARHMGAIRLPGASFLHDFIATERHLVFFVPPLRLSVLPMLLGRGGFRDNLRWRPELGTEIVVVPIDDPARPVRMTVEPFYQWHYANAFERGGEVVVDFVRYPDFASDRWVHDLHHGRPPGGRAPTDGVLCRAVIDPARRRFTWEPLWERTCDFPRVAPAVEASPHRLCHVAAQSAGASGLGWQDAIATIEVATGQIKEHALPAGCSTSEPVFVPRGNGDEDDGWLLALVHDAGRHTSHCAVFDARRLEEGPVARAHFDHHIPATFHGHWVPRAADTPP